jgi:hypothetical protein
MPESMSAIGHGNPLKTFGNWRAKFKADPQLSAPKLL